MEVLALSGARQNGRSDHRSYFDVALTSLWLSTPQRRGLTYAGSGLCDLREVPARRSRHS
jgi:hypothetical protein